MGKYPKRQSVYRPTPFSLLGGASTNLSKEERELRAQCLHEVKALELCSTRDNAPTVKDPKKSTNSQFQVVFLPLNDSNLLLIDVSMFFVGKTRGKSVIWK